MEINSFFNVCMYVSTSRAAHIQLTQVPDTSCAEAHMDSDLEEQSINM